MNNAPMNKAKVEKSLYGFQPAHAQRETGEGVTATIRNGLELLKHAGAYREAAKLCGNVRFDMTADELRGDE